MSGLFRNSKEAPEGKYLVTRRDGTIPEWMWFVLGSRDPAAPAALIAYAKAAEQLGYDPAYVRDVRHLAVDYLEDLNEHRAGDPDAGPHRKDDPETIEKMRGGRGA
jgi:hypothetical protein